jgi:DNA-binding transcriptional LysR family regulator
MLSWREAKLSLAHAQGSVTPVHAGSIEGGVEAAGRRLLACAVRAGFGTRSVVHAVGDGAPWILGQVEAQFGEQAHYLIDFYHVCERLSAAAASFEPDVAIRTAWVETQKAALKSGRLDTVLRTLAAHCEASEIKDEHAPVRCCHRYLDVRNPHLDYSRALADGLPIGSGEIESAHRMSRSNA